MASIGYLEKIRAAFRTPLSEIPSFVPPKESETPALDLSNAMSTEEAFNAETVPNTPVQSFIQDSSIDNPSIGTILFNASPEVVKKSPIRVHKKYEPKFLTMTQKKWGIINNYNKYLQWSKQETRKNMEEYYSKCMEIVLEEELEHIKYKWFEIITNFLHKGNSTIMHRDFTDSVNLRDFLCLFWNRQLAMKIKLIK
jgi:hypothetical protein